MKKTLAIIYHSQSGTTAGLVRSALQGAQQESDVNAVLYRAVDADLQQLIDAQAFLFAGAENFGAMSGMMKDFFDRTFYPAQAYHLAKPYALLISAGNDGSGAVRQYQRILSGYPMKQVLEPVIIKGEPDDEAYQRSEELGLTLAAGLSIGLF